MSAALAQALDRVHGLELELESAKSESKALKDEVAQKEGQLETLRKTVATQGEAIKGHSDEVGQLSGEIARLDAEKRAKDLRIEELGREIEGLRAEILAQNPQKQAEQQIAAEAMKRQAAEAAAATAAEAAAAQAAADKVEAKLAAKAAFKANIWHIARNAGLLAAVALLGLTVLDLFGVNLPVSIWFGVPGVAAAATVLIPWLDKYLEKIQISDKRFEYGTAILSAVIGGMIATFGIDKNFENWLNIILWIATTISYGLIFFLALKVVYILSRDGIPTDVKEKAKLLAVVGAVLLVCGIVTNLFHRIFIINVSNNSQFEVTRLISDNSHPLYFLGNAILSTMGIGIAMFLIGVLAWIGVRLLGTLSNTWRRSRFQIKEDKWLRYAKGVVVFVSIFVGYVVGSGYSYANGLTQTASYIMAIGVGLGCTTVFFLVEGKVLEACFRRLYPNKVLALMLLGALVFAALTAYLSFGKVYFEASRGPRFAEAQSILLEAENAYLNATQGTCEEFAKVEPDPSNNVYTESIKSMKLAIVHANDGHLVQSAREFQEAGKKAVDCLPLGKKNLLKDVVVYPDPTPSDLSSQYFWGQKLKGVSLHLGSARQALVAVIILDFLIAILAIFGWIFSSRKRPEVEAEEVAAEASARTGQIITIFPNGEVVIDLRLTPLGALEEEDELAIKDEKGETIGWLVKPEPFGNGAAKCKLSGRSEAAKPGSTVVISAK